MDEFIDGLLNNVVAPQPVLRPAEIHKPLHIPRGKTVDATKSFREQRYTPERIAVYHAMMEAIQEHSPEGIALIQAVRASRPDMVFIGAPFRGWYSAKSTAPRAVFLVTSGYHVTVSMEPFTPAPPGADYENRSPNDPEVERCREALELACFRKVAGQPPQDIKATAIPSDAGRGITWTVVDGRCGKIVSHRGHFRSSDCYGGRTYIEETDPAKMGWARPPHAPISARPPLDEVELEGLLAEIDPGFRRAM